MKRAITFFVLLFLLCALSAGHAAVAPVQIGEDSMRVAAVQLRLFALGYFAYRPTANFGTVTQNAVRAFQKAALLPEDGDAGEKTLSALFAYDAPSAPFAANVPLKFAAPQGEIKVFGSVLEWDEVRTVLTVGVEITVTHAHYATSCTLIITETSGHAHLVPKSDEDAQTLNKWLGESNSLYKCAVIAKIPRPNAQGEAYTEQNAAAALQWDGAGKVCLYFTGSVSDIFGLPDTEMDTFIYSCVRR